MFRFVRPLLLGSVFLGIGPGCAHVIETHAINQFADALQDHSLKGLRSSTSDGFQQKALRSDLVLDDLKVLKLPTGKLSVVDVKDISPTEKRVTVMVTKQSGRSKTKRQRKMQYKLTRQPKTGRWVVDDVYVRQKRNGIKVTKAVSDQLNLLISVREFVDAWDSGDRHRTLEVTAPEFARVLGDLPPAYLRRLTRRVIGKQEKPSKRQPQASMDSNVAIVMLPRAAGRAMLSLKKINGGWKVNEISVEPKGGPNRIPSVRALAEVLLTSTRFLRAYGAQDRDALAKLCSRKFYRESLSFADLTTAPLPQAASSANHYDAKIRGRRAEFVLPGEKRIVRISLARPAPRLDRPAVAATEPFRVEDVTIYKAGSRQETRLSAWFTAQAMTSVFADALTSHDLVTLRKASTRDFNDRVWNRIDRAALRKLPLNMVSAPKIVSTIFRGAVTEVTTRTNGRTIVFRLRDHQGQVRVDDLLVSVPGRPTSVKQTLQYLWPILSFRTALEASRVGAVERVSSKDFNRLIWKQVEGVPNLGHTAVRYLRAPLSRIDRQGEGVLVTLGDGRSGAKLLLVPESGQFVVDDILLIAGPQPEQRVRLKQTLREQMADHDRALSRNPIPAFGQTLSDRSLSDRSLSDRSVLDVREAARQVTPASSTYPVAPASAEPTVPLVPAADAFAPPAQRGRPVSISPIGR